MRYRILIDRERAEQLARRAAKSRRGRATSAGLIVERVEPVSRNLSAPKPQDESGLAQWKRGWGRS